ncbi:MAG TPA: ribosome maturation factor RimM [Chitinophagaceae bacterium]|nr:ribosome maturation factor RimM [Chitinophagaceae bacterium]
MHPYFKIGTLAATFGLNGQLILVHNLGKKTSLKGLENIFIEETPDSFIPYFLTSSKMKNDREVCLQLEGINSKETAAKFIKKEVWLTEQDFKKFSSATAPVSLLGFTIVNKKRELGEVIEVIEQPHQVLCRIYVNGKEAFIPVHENTLEKIDKKNGKLYVNLPDGLLEIYE